MVKYSKFFEENESKSFQIVPVKTIVLKVVKIARIQFVNVRIKEVIANGIGVLMKIQYFGVDVFMIVMGISNAKINVLLNSNRPKKTVHARYSIVSA